MKLSNIILLMLSIGMSLTACTTVNTATYDDKTVASDPSNNGLERLAKSNIDEVIELHQRAVMRDLKTLIVKLYRRNPGERHDKDVRKIRASVDLIFSMPIDQIHPKWQSMKSTDIVHLAFDDSFHGDRVLAFAVGLRKMLMSSYDNHTEFYYFTSIDEQKIYNSARNIEIAAWMLAQKHDSQGKLFLLSDSLENEQRNLSFQRLIGQMIATQDNLAEIISRKTGRLIKTVVLRAATMVFIPI